MSDRVAPPESRNKRRLYNAISAAENESDYVYNPSPYGHKKPLRGQIKGPVATDLSTVDLCVQTIADREYQHNTQQSAKHADLAVLIIGA